MTKHSKGFCRTIYLHVVPGLDEEIIKNDPNFDCKRVVVTFQYSRDSPRLQNMGTFLMPKKIKGNSIALYLRFKLKIYKNSCKAFHHFLFYQTKYLVNAGTLAAMVALANSLLGDMTRISDIYQSVSQCRSVPFLSILLYSWSAIHPGLPTSKHGLILSSKIRP